MNPEELAAKIFQLEERNIALEATASRVSELEARFAPPVDSDEEFKPKTWKGLNDSMNAAAESAALRAVQEADKKKEEIRANEEKIAKTQNEAIDATLKKLQEEGIILESKDKTDAGGKQRTEVLGLTLRMGGSDVEAAARSLKTAWDMGLHYNYEKNTYEREGSAPSQTRNAPVASSAARTPAPAVKAPINTLGLGGDLDQARKRWETVNGAI